jgi:hypothetical protein
MRFLCAIDPAYEPPDPTEYGPAMDADDADEAATQAVEQHDRAVAEYPAQRVVWVKGTRGDEPTRYVVYLTHAPSYAAIWTPA